MVDEASISLPIDVPDTVRKDMSPFYNPVMRTNRDVSLAAVDVADESFDAYFPLAGTGIRALRGLTESDAFDTVTVNDVNQHFPTRFRTYAEENDVSLTDVSIKNEDARSLAFDLRSFDYVEIDPFGSPNPFLDSCIQQLRDGGIIAITATDTAPLSGTYPTTCRRKYWATPHRTHEMHAFALRILIRKAQLLGAHHNRALRPLVSYASDHYFKVILRCENSKQGAHAVQEEHGVVRRDDNVVGPMWLGSLNDASFVERMRESDVLLAEKTVSLLDRLIGEAGVDQIGFFDVHETASDIDISSPPSIMDVVTSLEEAGFVAARTHLSHTGVTTDASYDSFCSAMRSS